MYDRAKVPSPTGAASKGSKAPDNERKAFADAPIAPFIGASVDQRLEGIPFQKRSNADMQIGEKSGRR